MSKPYLYLIAFLCFQISTAQRTIEVARLFVVNLYFEEPISNRIDLGDPLYYQIKRDNNRFSITVNAEMPPVDRLTNITFQAKSGNVYTFLLKTTEQPSVFNIPVSVKEASLKINQVTKQIIQSEEKTINTPEHQYSERKPINDKNTLVLLDSLSNDNSVVPSDALYELDKKAYMKRKIFYHKSNTPDLYRYYARNGKVFLKIYSVQYNKNELYLFFNLDNQEGVDYDINTLQTFIGTNKKKKNSYQKIKMTPIFTYDMPTRVQGGKEHLFALVFEKFALDANKSLFVEIDELNGSRNIELIIDPKTLSNPKRF